MVGAFSVLKSLPVVAVGVLGVSYPPTPEDLSTPVQQRLAVYGPNGRIIRGYPF